MKPVILLAATSAVLVSHASIGIEQYALVFIAIAYTVSLVRDWRPIRALRAENAELRRELVEARQQVAENGKRLETLEKSRDFKSAFDESLRAIDQAREQAKTEHEELLRAVVEVQRGLAGITTVVSTLAAGINAGLIPPASGG